MLTLTHVTKTFNKGTVNEKPALTGVDLHLEPGDFVTVIGGNGAGKSTLHRARRPRRHAPAGAQARRRPGPRVPGPHARHRG